MKKLLIVTDLGQLRAYAVTQEDNDPSPVIDLIRESDFLGRRHQFADRDTSPAGRFPTGGGGMSSGEQNQELLEAERVRVRQVADAVTGLAEGDQAADIYFAAPKPVHRQIVSLFHPSLKQRIRRSLELDLVKLPKRELLLRFEQT